MKLGSGVEASSRCTSQTTYALSSWFFVGTARMKSQTTGVQTSGVTGGMGFRVKLPVANKE